MEAKDFADRLIERVTLDEVDFACDVEKLLAEQVSYLRRLVEILAADNACERDATVHRLQRRIVEQGAQIAQLTAANERLRARIVPQAGRDAAPGIGAVDAAQAVT